VQSRGGQSGLSPLRSDGSHDVQGELDRINSGQRHSKGELDNNSRKLRDLLKNRHSDSLKKDQLTPSQGMMKKGDDVAVDDDVVRTSVSQNIVTSILCTEELFLGTQYI
jgi:hypothetical protein